MGKTRGENLDFDRLCAEICENGITNLPGILSVGWAKQLGQDINRQFVAALEIDNGEGVAFRGWNRYYIELYPERLRGFKQFVQNVAITGLSRKILGDRYQIVELGADIPLPGAPEQPPHRDFPLPEPTRLHRVLTSLAFNASSVNVTPGMGPFAVVPGTHFDDGSDFVGGMFPVGEQKEKYNQLMELRYAKMGSVSARSGLAIHKGTANNGRMRQVVILGVVSPDDRAHSDTTIDLPEGYEPPTLQMSQQYYDSLSDELKEHLRCEIVAETTKELPPLKTPHTIEGLIMGKAPA
jgi:hypothetical protein